MSETQDTELTLSTGKLLFIFFSLVALCAVFFSLGYAVGRGNREGAPPITETSTTTPLAANGAKPAAGVGAQQPAVNACPADGTNCTPTQPTGDKESSTSNELSFVKDKAATNLSASTSQAPTTKTQAPADKKLTIRTDNTASGNNALLPATGVMVQVAAVSKQTDADALVSALRKKQYPVIVVNNVPGSTLFHVQVGPFVQQKDAEATQKKLQQDGYNAIIKK